MFFLWRLHTILTSFFLLALFQTHPDCFISIIYVRNMTISIFVVIIYLGYVAIYMKKIFFFARSPHVQLKLLFAIFSRFSHSTNYLIGGLSCVCCVLLTNTHTHNVDTEHVSSVSLL